MRYYVLFALVHQIYFKNHFRFCFSFHLFFQYCACKREINKSIFCKKKHEKKIRNCAKKNGIEACVSLFFFLVGINDFASVTFFWLLTANNVEQTTRITIDNLIKSHVLSPAQIYTIRVLYSFVT